jgi:chemotaxis protein CheX
MSTEIKKEEFEATCAVFIDAVNNYFEHLTKSSSELGVPYLKEQADILLDDYTGMIGISGSRKGFIYVSGKTGLYKALIKQFIGLDDPSEEDILDMAGELSNVVAGNLRETYGNDFMISVPVVFQGRPSKLHFPNDVSVYVIPISWREHEANLVIGIE